MKRLLLILSLFLSFQAFGQIPTSPTLVNQMTWYRDFGGHMWAYRGATLGWVQIVDASQLSSFGSVTSVTPGIAFTNHTPITTTGTLDIDTALIRSGLARDFNVLHLTGNEIIASGAIKTFTSSPIIPNASSSNQPVAFGQLANYVDKTTTQSGIGGDKTFTGQVNANSFGVIGSGNYTVVNNALTNFGILENSGLTIYDTAPGLGLGSTVYNRASFSYSNGTNTQSIAFASPTGVNTNILFPNKSGTVALVGDTTGIGNLLNAKVDTAIYDLVINIGQSNALGHGDSTSSIRVLPGVSLMYSGSAIKATRDPVGGAIFGSYLPSFANKYYTLTNRKTFVINLGKGGSSMTAAADGGNGNWSSTGALRQAARDTVLSAITKFQATGRKIGRIIILWKQGEQDGPAILAGTITSAQYRSDLLDLIAYYKITWPKLTFNILKIGRVIGGGNDTYRFIRSSDDLLDTTKNVNIISRNAYDDYNNGYLNGDLLHQNQKGLNATGIEAAENFVKVEKTRAQYSLGTKSGFNVKEPLAYVDMASATDSIPSAIIRKGIAGSIVLDGAIRKIDGYHTTIADSTLAIHQLLQSQTAAPLLGNTSVGIMAFGGLNGFVGQDSLFRYDRPNKRLAIRTLVPLATLDLTSETSGSSSNALQLKNSSATVLFNVRGDGIITGLGPIRMNSYPNAAWLGIQGSGNTSSTVTAEFTNSSGTTGLRVRDDGQINIPGTLNLSGLSATTVAIINSGKNLTGTTNLAVTLGGLGTITAPAIGQVPVATSTSVYTPTTPTGTGTPVFSIAPTLTGILTYGSSTGTIRPTTSIQSATGGTTDSLVFSNTQKLVKKIIVAGTGMSTTQTATSYTPAVDTNVVATKANSFTKAQMQTRFPHAIFVPTTGGTVNLGNSQYNIINPAGALVALTVNLPASPVNNNILYIKFTQAVTTVTYTGGTVVGAITSPVAGGLIMLSYDSASTSWY